MKLYLAGVNHFNPLCRLAVEEWLAQMAVERSRPPAFIAVESSEPALRCFLEQRPRFRRLAQQAWPRLSPEHLDLFTASLGYEGDVHLRIFPEADVLWLEANRQYKEIVRWQAEARMRTFCHWQEAGAIWGAASGLLEQINTMTGYLTYNDVMSQQPNDHPERDAEWTEMLLHRCDAFGHAWGIVIVGAIHLADVPGYLFHALRASGVDCKAVHRQPLLPPA